MKISNEPSPFQVKKQRQELHVSWSGELQRGLGDAGEPLKRLQRGLGDAGEALERLQAMCVHTVNGLHVKERRCFSERDPVRSSKIKS